MDIDVTIINRRAKVPGTDLYVWQYLEQNPGWTPGPELRVKPEPLPTRTFDTSELLNQVFKTAVGNREKGDYNPLPTANPIIQFLGRKQAVDLRRWRPKGNWDTKLQRYTGPDQPHGKVSGSLFLNTVHYCFSDHYPLGIRPEVLMYMVLHEVGVTVKQNPNDYRDLFTTSEGKELIRVQVDELDLDNLDSPWHLGVERINAMLKKKVPSEIMAECLPGFSTDNLESTTASMIAFMDAASPYYDYLVRTCCGIPKIRMFGEAKDYRRLLESCQKLASRFEKHLGLYFKYLIPVLEKILAQVSGAEPHDNDFWSSIYNHYSGSGRDDMDGWITAFVNYEYHGGKFYQKKESLFDWKTNLSDEKRYGEGINRDVMPSHLSCVPFLWQYAKDHVGRQYKQEGGVVFDCRLVGGLLGIENVDGFATPVLSYAVLRGAELKQDRKGEGPDQDITVQAEGQDPVKFKRGHLEGGRDNSKYNS